MAAPKHCALMRETITFMMVMWSNSIYLLIIRILFYVKENSYRVHTRNWFYRGFDEPIIWTASNRAQHRQFRARSQVSYDFFLFLSPSLYFFPTWIWTYTVFPSKFKVYFCHKIYSTLFHYFLFERFKLCCLIQHSQL